MSIFMKIDGITGETADSGHVGWMDVVSIGWSVNRQITAASSTKGDRESNNAVISDLKVSRLMDSATPDLFSAACCGKGTTVIIHLTKTGAGQGADKYMEYTLENALVSNYTVDANKADAERPAESITISFTAIKVAYTPYKDDGTPDGNKIGSYDTSTNVFSG